MSRRSTPRQYRHTSSRMAARSASSFVIGSPSASGRLSATLPSTCLVFSWESVGSQRNGDAMARLGFNLMGVDELYGGRFSGILEAAALADRAGVDLLVLPDHVTISEQAHRDRVTVGFPYPISA